MADLVSLHPTVSFHITVVFGIGLSFSTAMLSFLLHRLGSRSKGRKPPPRPSSRWRIEYHTRSGVQFRISKTPAAAPMSKPTASPETSARGRYS
jgi:hypothetical protein